MKFCPSCGDDISKYIDAESGHPAARSVAIQPSPGKYDAVATRKEILGTAEGRKASPPSIDKLIESALAGIKPGAKRTIVHIAFDREIVPSGGVLYRATMLEGRTTTDADRLKKQGYAVDENDHLVTVDDVPVGRLYQSLMYWGGDKQHKRWHMKYPVEVNPSRNGELYFMDENIVAFGVDWADTSKMHEAFANLLSSVSGDDDIGVPLVLQLQEQ